MLTYGYSADIPNKLSIFYNQAYEALYQRHDALKGAYKRDRESDLDIISFERVLSAFCILTYDERKFQFSRVEALQYIRKSSELVGINVNQDHFLEDLMQAVCFLVQDGLFLTFTHRSFQEYFTAKFIVNTHDQKIKKELLKKFYPDLWRDNIYELVYELDPTFFETDIILPFLNEFFTRIGLKKKVGKTNFMKYCKVIYKHIEVDPKRGGLAGLINDSKAFHMIQIIYQHVPNLNSYPHIDMGESKLKKELIDECEKEGKERQVFSFSSITTRDFFFNRLFNSDSYYSPKELEYLVSIRDFLEKKHRGINNDLTKLVTNKASNRHYHP